MKAVKDPLTITSRAVHKTSLISGSDLLKSTQTRGHNRQRVRSTEVISSTMAAALDRANVSDRKAAFIISEAAQTYGQDADTMAISFSSIRRSRMMHRAQHAKAVKSDSFGGPLVVHIDGKLLPAINGKPEKEDRLAVVVTGVNGEKLLGIPKIV